MSKRSKQKEKEKIELLYNYWYNIPLVTNIEYNDGEVLSHEARSLILRFLRKGLKEKIEDGTERIRYAFSAKEILDEVNTQMKEEMKLQSMYFHLQKLQEYGLIEVIAMLHKGRHNTAYFGRTARGFLFESQSDKYDDYFSEGGKFASKASKKIPESKFKELLKDFRRINKEAEIRVKEWIKGKEDFINTNNIDSATIFSFIRRIEYHNKDMTKLMKEIAEYLEYEI